MPKRALLTGSSGFIGSFLAKELRKRFRLIKVDARSSSGRLDLTDSKQVRKLPAVDIVFHLAAMMNVAKSFLDPKIVYINNITSTLNILEYCRRNKIKKLIFTSSYVYGKPQYLPVDEKHPLCAANPYMHSKIICEELCRKYSDWFNLDCVILRPFNIYGPGQSKEHLIPEIISQLPNDEVILADPKPKRDLLFVSDLIIAYLKAADYKKKGCAVFNIGYGKSFSVEEIAKLIVRISKSKASIKYLNKERKNEIMNVVADTRKALRLLGWKPKVSFYSGIKMTIGAK